MYISLNKAIITNEKKKRFKLAKNPKNYTSSPEQARRHSPSGPHPRFPCRAACVQDKCKHWRHKKICAEAILQFKFQSVLISWDSGSHQCYTSHTRQCLPFHTLYPRGFHHVEADHSIVVHDDRVVGLDEAHAPHISCEVENMLASFNDFLAIIVYS
jgi:hypothetical protein